MASNTNTALVLINQNEFKMPKFGKRTQHLKQILTEITKEQQADVIENTESNANKAILKISDSIGEGTFTVEPQQHDVTGKQS